MFLNYLENIQIPPLAPHFVKLHSYNCLFPLLLLPSLKARGESGVGQAVIPFYLIAALTRYLLPNIQRG